MVIVVVVALALVQRIGVRRGWSVSVWIHDQWHAAAPHLVRYVRAAPGTVGYLVVLAVTTWVLLGTSTQVTTLLLQEHSTNLHQLRVDPIRVLIRSAFWVPGYAFLAWAVLFTAVLAPAERWLGTRRWAAVFVSGHVLATLATASMLSVLVATGAVSSDVENTVDVGVSYGFAAVAALFTFRLPMRWRWPWATALATVAAATAVLTRNVADLGHVAAVLIGFACYPLSRRPDVQARANGPIWRLPTNGPTRTPS